MDVYMLEGYRYFALRKIAIKSTPVWKIVLHFAGW